MSGDDRDSSVTWIRQWDASYYCPTFKKWFYGELKLSTNALLFTHSESPSESTQVYLDFMQIKDISRATSSFIFPSITVKSANDDFHWFSSFQDRNATFIVIRHFFEASLMVKTSGQTPDSQPLFSQSTTHRTKLGTNLLNSVYDSDATLKNAASNLAQQGDQLRGLMCTMQDVHQDLIVAERITTGLQSWLGRWKVPKANKATGIILVKDSDIPDVLDMEVLYTRVLSSRVDPQTLGVCRVAAGGLSILDMKQKIIHHFKWSEVSRVRAVSPWEILVTQYLIGQPDLSYNIVSVELPRILCHITRFAGGKVEYMEPVQDTKNHGTNLKNLQVSGPISTDSLQDCRSYEPHHHQRQQHQQQQQQQQQARSWKDEMISDSEVSELSAALTSIKATALGVSSEQDAQLDDIDHLTSSVTRANDRIKAMNRTMDKLLK